MRGRCGGAAAKGQTPGRYAMPETRPPTRITRKAKAPRRRRTLDPRAADTGLDSLETEISDGGVGYAEERASPDTEHKVGREAEGPAT